MQRLGLNLSSYRGEQIQIDRVLDQLGRSARHFGWREERIEPRPGVSLYFYQRPSPIAAQNPKASVRRIYISAGIHGDEPAGPLAVQTLVRENQWPEDAEIWLCPCLNPTGFLSNTRENDQGIDLNRDYLHRQSAEVIHHLRWLDALPSMDLALCLHEDWEAGGFYCYELNPDNQRSCAEPMVQAVSRICPIEKAAVIDGREADKPGIIRPSIDPTSRPQWPEAFHLLVYKTRLSYTLESPSDFPLTTRVAALVVATHAAMESHARAASKPRTT